MARCKTASLEKLGAYSLEYVEDFSGPKTTQMVADHRKESRNWLSLARMFMTVRREIAEPHREIGARTREDPMRARAVW